jgi:hypothetical protein
MNRIVDLEEGVALVVSDLHGDGDAYARYRDRFLDLRARGQANYFILLGDLLHRPPPEADDSLAMILDVLRLKEELGDRLIYLMGNHELPHRYAITLRRGDDLFTPRFEWAMGEHRAAIMALLDSLPFYVRTRGGVALAHAGAAPPAAPDLLFNWSHEAVLGETAVSLPPALRPRLRRLIGFQSGQTYEQFIHDAFAITSPDDPRYDDPLIGHSAIQNHPHAALLWEALFTRNELQYGRANASHLRDFLQALSAGRLHPQRVLVSGHIDCKGGYALVEKQQLRLASGKHAHPREAGLYLLFDVAQPIQQAIDLLPSLASVFA